MLCIQEAHGRPDAVQTLLPEAVRGRWLFAAAGLSIAKGGVATLSPRQLSQMLRMWTSTYSSPAGPSLVVTQLSVDRLLFELAHP